WPAKEDYRGRAFVECKNARQGRFALVAASLIQFDLVVVGTLGETQIRVRLQPATVFRILRQGVWSCTFTGDEKVLGDAKPSQSGRHRAAGGGHQLPALGAILEYQGGFPVI